MTGESNDVIAIYTLSGCLKSLAAFFQPITSKTNRILARDFFRALKKLEIIARNSDRFIVLFAPVVIGRSYYFAILVFRQSSENRSNWSDCEPAWYRQVALKV